MQGQVTIKRFDPEREAAPHYETYSYPFQPGMSVLDVVFYVYEQIDGALGFSYCCRNSHCGLCGAKINGEPGLMCRESATRELLLEPLDNLPVLRDLSVDREAYSQQKGALRLFLDRVDPYQDKVRPEKVDMRTFDQFKTASRCVECYCCLSSCPVYGDARHQFAGPTAFVQLSRHAFDPRDDGRRDVLALSSGLYNCSGCGVCAQVCPHEISPAYAIRELRHQLEDRAHPALLRPLTDLVAQTEKAIPLSAGKTAFTASHGQPPVAHRGQLGLFVGCSIDNDPRLKPVAEAALLVLEKLGYQVYVPSEQVCCGTPLREVGAVAPLAQLIEKNIALFEQAGCQTVLSLCGGCGEAMKKLWPAYCAGQGRELPFTPLDFSEFIAAAAPEFTAPLEIKTVYHDPCTLLRGQGVSREPRQILAAIPGLDLAELEHQGQCCGAGGGLRMTNNQLSQHLACHRAEEIRASGAQLVVTACPNCIKQLNLALTKAGQRQVSVQHLAVTVAQAMGLL